MTLYYANQYVTTTLSKVGGLNATDTTGIVLASTDGVDTSNPGIALLSYQDPLDTSKAEWITYTSINGSKELVGVARAQEGSTAKTHSDGCAIAFPISKSHINNINTAMVLEHDNTGHHSGVGIYNSFYRQAIVDGGCQVAQGADGTLSTSKVYGKVDLIYGIAEGTVGAGTITQTTSPNVGSIGTAFKLSGVTLTGSGKVKAGYRMEAKDAVKLKNKTISFGVKVYHDVGSAKTYTIYLNKANSADNFSAVTAISNNGGTSVESAAATELKYQAVALGDCSNGLEIIVECTCGAITTKNFEFAEFQLNLGSVLLPFQAKPFDDELRACMRYYQVLGTASVTYQLGGFDPKIDGGSNYRYYFPLTLSPMRADVTGTSFSAAGTSGKATVGDNGIYVGDPANVDTSGSCVLYIPANGRGYGIATHNATFHVLRFYGTFSARL